MGTSQHSSPGVIFQQPSETLVPLLCSLVDLLAMKVKAMLKTIRFDKMQLLAFSKIIMCFYFISGLL